MVQLKASSLLLAALAVGCVAEEVVATEYATRELKLTARETWLHDRMVRAAVEVQEARRSTGPETELEARGLEGSSGEGPQAHALAPVTSFFLNVGEIIKRAAEDYWKGMKADVGVLDFSAHKRHGNFHPPPTEPVGPPELRARGFVEPTSTAKPKAHGESPWRQRRNTPKGATTRPDWRARRRRFADDMITRDTSAASGPVRRHHLEHPTYKQRRRRWDNGRMAPDTLPPASDALAGRDVTQQSTYKQRRRRWEDGHQARDVADLLDARAAVPDELVPRMSWFSNALLIYCDVDTSLSSPKRTNPLWNRVKRGLEELD
jgi:hypothetical protein